MHHIYETGQYKSWCDPFKTSSGKDFALSASSVSNWMTKHFSQRWDRNWTFALIYLAFAWKVTDTRSNRVGLEGLCQF